MIIKFFFKLTISEKNKQPQTSTNMSTLWPMKWTACLLLMKQSRCEDYGLALNSAWSYLERNSEPSVTDLSAWRLLVHGTVFWPVSLQQLSWLPSKDN